MTRCEWCGVFVKAGTPLTRWRSISGYDHEWHEHAKVLCPGCSASASVNLPHWARVQEAEQ